jgi:hypothetical protein
MATYQGTIDHPDNAKVRSAVGLLVGVVWIDGCGPCDWGLLRWQPRPLHVPYRPIASGLMPNASGLTPLSTRLKGLSELNHLTILAAHSE